MEYPMYSDEGAVGRSLTRRDLARLLARPAARRSSGAAQSAPDAGLEVQHCIAQPRQTEGPYFVDEGLRRSDLRIDPGTGRISEGVPLELRFIVSAALPSGACAVMSGARVDIWHCDAAGVYSEVQDKRADTRGQRFLRGYQVTDVAGTVRFRTIYPGWYPGRAVHIHLKIRVPGIGGGTDEFTSQLYFDDSLTDRVHARPPYSAKRGQRLLNPRDMIFRDGGSRLLLPVVDDGEGYAAMFRIAMRPGEPAPAGPAGRT
jgi:protocatechuate 3,4-dioxygenase beta subunit